MELSIIVSVYNMAEDVRLEYCLNSLLRQTISDFEIIAVDDASTDHTSEILLDYAAHYPDVFKVVLSNRHGGRGGARNLGLEHARGKWIGFVESCDWVLPQMYEKLLQRANETGADMVACDYHIAHEDSTVIGPVVHEHYEAQTGVLDTEKHKLLLLDSGHLVTKIYKRKVIRDCGMSFPEQIFCEDKAMECALTLRAKHFEYVAEPLYSRCRYGDAVKPAAKTADGEKSIYVQDDFLYCQKAEIGVLCEDRIEAAHIMLKYAQDFGCLKNYRDEMEFKITELLYISSLFACLEDAGIKDIGLLSTLQREIRCIFPGFEENTYYRERIGEEAGRFICLQRRGTRRMLWSYELKEFAGHLDKGGWKDFGVKAAGMLLGVVLCLIFVSVVLQDKKSAEYPVVILGDSIVANDYVGDELNEMLTKALGEEVFNGGFGGSYLCNQNLNGYESCGEESLSMEELAESIITGDFLVQKSSIQRNAKLSYYEGRLEELSQIDFEKTNTLIIEHCVNDYVLQISPEHVGESLKKIITKLQKRYPNLQIVVSSPTYCYIVKNGENIYCDTTGLGPYLLEEYVLVEELVCEELGVIFVDNYHQDVITKDSLADYSVDGLHLNEAGRQFLAENILAVMEAGYSK